MTVLQNAVLRKSQLVFGAVAGIQELTSKRLQKKCRVLAERENPFRIMEFTNFLNCGQHHLFVLQKVEGNIPHTAMPDAKAFAGGVITGKRFIGLMVVDRVEEKSWFISMHAVTGQTGNLKNISESAMTARFMH